MNTKVAASQAAENMFYRPKMSLKPESDVVDMEIQSPKAKTRSRAVETDFPEEEELQT